MSSSYSERFAKIQEFKEQPTYHPLDRTGYQPFRPTKQVGQGLNVNAMAFDQHYVDGETQEQVSQLAETMLDED